MKHWKILMALLFAGCSMASTHFGYLLLHTKYPDASIVPWCLALPLVLMALVFAQEDGAAYARAQAARK